MPVKSNIGNWIIAASIIVAYLWYVVGESQIQDGNIDLVLTTKSTTPIYII